MIGQRQQRLVGHRYDRIGRGERFDVEHIGGSRVLGPGARPEQALFRHAGVGKAPPCRRRVHLPPGPVGLLRHCDAEPSAPPLASNAGRKMPAARIRSCSASPKKIASSETAPPAASAMLRSYRFVFRIALSKIVGLDVSPVRANSLMYLAMVPSSR